ncbi:MAG TPA: MoxR family ATPase [Verrucomicrobiae bacterium]|nr:MoxR family ATPase [Verrucomicrobiae bacterium]
MPHTNEFENEVAAAGQLLALARDEIARAVVGQRELVDCLFIGLLTNSHVLLEGVPGLAKTTTVKALASVIDAKFHRVQFTPDLLPSDVVGTLVYNARTAEYSTRFGPIFCNVLLADEINRAAPKVQSALLEAMQEQQVTIGEKSYALPDPFLVLATENPIEHEGTYPLPEAQMDRFMLKVDIDYPSPEEERQIMDYIADEGAKPRLDPILTVEQALCLRETTKRITLADALKNYIVRLVTATRDAGSADAALAPLIRYGASPRASINLAKASRAKALLDGRAYVIPEDIKAVAPAILCHRILVTYEAEAEEVTTPHIVGRLLECVPVP